MYIYSSILYHLDLSNFNLHITFSIYLYSDTQIYYDFGPTLLISVFGFVPHYNMMDHYLNTF